MKEREREAAIGKFADYLKGSGSDSLKVAAVRDLLELEFELLEDSPQLDLIYFFQKRIDRRISKYPEYREAIDRSKECIDKLEEIYGKRPNDQRYILTARQLALYQINRFMSFSRAF